MSSMYETAESEHQDAGGGFRQVAHDAIALGELQYELFVEDCKEAGRRASWSAAAIAGGLVTILASLPVLLLAFSFLIAMLGLAVGFAMLIVAAVTLAIGALTCWLGWRRMRRASSVLRRSGDEFRANMAWLRRSLRPRDRRGYVSPLPR